MSKVFLTDRALDELQETYAYSVEKFGERVAIDYLNHFNQAFNLIKANPKLLRQNPQISSSFLIYPVQKNYLVKP